MKTGAVSSADLAKPCPNGHLNCWAPKCRLLPEITADVIAEFLAIEVDKRQIARRVRALEERSGRPLSDLRTAINRRPKPIARA